jgi:hypothetical protein
MKTKLRIDIFLILLFLAVPGGYALAQSIDFGKSYENITKGIGGGTIEPGDTLEIRAAFVVRAGTYDSCSFNDAIPSGTSFIPGSIRVLTNEGKTYKAFTDAFWDDAGWFNGSSVTINLGYNPANKPATASRRGQVRNTDKPSFFGSTCIMIATYRVRVTAGLGGSVNTGGGILTYKNGVSPIQTTTFPNNYVAVYTNIGMCPNTVGVNALGTEFNGTFGSGKPRNRVSSGNVPPSYTYAIFDVNGPNDYYYGIANNTSTRSNYTTLNTWAKPDATAPTHRVFQVWDIIGDHTGAASPSAGNSAADTVANGNAGYMLVINASYRIDSAFQQTISGLCPNTYYEISCWVRNICSKCGCDSNGKGASAAGYLPTAPGDSSGVYPNLTFDVDGLDYYTTGDIKYTSTWVKKGFTFLTGPAQTSFTLKFFNNAPGGGGNDWALDDISVSTCYPNLTVNPTPVYAACAGNVVNFGATVRSFFNNYTHYKWQKSTDAGSTWSDAGFSGTGFPTLVAGQYEYSVLYPPFIANMSDSGSKYRLVVGTTVANLSDPNCSSSSPTDITTLKVQDCMILPMRLSDWSGLAEGGFISLHWKTENETQPVTYEVLRSTDGMNFQTVGHVIGESAKGPANTYSFALAPSSGTSYYRLRVIPSAATAYYSEVITLSSGDQQGFGVKTAGNPFRDVIRLNVDMPDQGLLKLRLTDIYGTLVASRTLNLSKGTHTTGFDGLSRLPSGIYLLQAEAGADRKNLKLMKD